jgi:hypothetical protein
MRTSLARTSSSVSIALGTLMRPITSIGIVVLLLIAPGACTLKNYGIFIGTLDEDVTLEVRNLQSNGGWGEVRRFTVPKRGEKKIDYAIPEVAALNPSGRVLFRQVLPVLRPEIDAFQKPGERQTFLLLTRNGAYPIPVAWRETWKDHMTEIISNYDIQTARQHLLKDGALKE